MEEKSDSSSRLEFETSVGDVAARLMHLLLDFTSSDLVDSLL